MSNTPDPRSAPGPMEPPLPPPVPSPESSATSIEAPPPPPPGAGATPPASPPPPSAQAAGAPPGQAAPHYSPDGRWWWNGNQWLPAPQSGLGQPPPPPARHSRTTAGILAILLGDFGVHKFYLGNTGLGVLYLLFCWTLIPGIIGILEGIQYLTMSDEQFTWKFG